MGMDKMMKQIQETLARMQEEVGKLTGEASAGGGMVTAVADGRGQLVELRLAREVVDPGDVEMLQDLVVAAANEAIRKAREAAETELQNRMAKLIPPGLLPPGLLRG